MTLVLDVIIWACKHITKSSVFQKYDDMVCSFKTWNEVGELTGHTAYDHNGDKIKKLI